MPADCVAQDVEGGESSSVGTSPEIPLERVLVPSTPQGITV